MGVMLAYDRNELPSLSIFLPIKLLVWSLVLDFFFYWYHRLMHQVPALWKFHRSECNIQRALERSETDGSFLLQRIT
jgi:hypothetical protein